MLTRDQRLHALGRPQGETQGTWPPRPTRRRRLLLLRARRKNAKSLSALLQK
jgi:hypothetical protein